MPAISPDHPNTHVWFFEGGAPPEQVAETMAGMLAFAAEHAGQSIEWNVLVGYPPAINPPTTRFTATLAELH